MPGERDKARDAHAAELDLRQKERSAASRTATLIAGGLAGGFIVLYVVMSQDWQVGGEPRSLTILAQCFFFSIGGYIGGIAAFASAIFMRRYISPFWLAVTAVPLGAIVGGLSSLGGCFLLAVLCFGGAAPPGFFHPMTQERSPLDASPSP